MSNPTDCGDAHAAHPDDSDGDSEIDWQHLYEMHAPLVRRHAAKFVDPSLVDDIVQETFLRAYRNRQSIRPDRPLGPWLTVIARRAAIDVVRRQQVHERVSSELPRPLPPPEPIEDDYFNAVRGAGIRHVFGDLNERHRRVLARAVLQTGPGEERTAADDSTRSTLARARGRFRERYLELSRQTGVFGGAVAAVRRRSASARDSLVRAEAWLQSGMPVLIAAYAGLSASAVAASATATAPMFGAPATAGGRGEAPLEPNALLHAFRSPLSLASDAGSGTSRTDTSKDGDSAGTSAPTTRTSVDWYAGSDGDTAGIYLFVRVESPSGGSHADTTSETYCHANPPAEAQCAAWDLIPESRRRLTAEGDAAGTGVQFLR